MLRELTDALEAVSADTCVVLCLEDLHWSDAATLDWIASFARRPERARILLIGTWRPGEAASARCSPDTLANELRIRGLCSEISLERLDAQAVAAYVREQFRPEADNVASLTALAEIVHHHTEGNPLFVVNVLDDLIARDVLFEHEGRWRVREAVHADMVGIPPDIHRAIEHQIERLDDIQRRLLEVASILGNSCSAAALAAGADMSESAVEEYLGALARRHILVRTHNPVEWPDGTVSATFGFLHALYREVLAKRLAPARRAAMHRAIATRLVAAFGDRSSLIAAELAVHFDEARDFPRAITFHERAALNDRARNAHESAHQHFLRALTLLDTLPASTERDQREIALRTAMGSVLMQMRGWGAPEVEETYGRARALCEKHGDSRQLFPTLWNLWVFHTTHGRLHTARTLAERLSRLACASTDPESLLQAHHANWTTLFSLGDLRGTLLHADMGLRLYQPERSGPNALEYGGHNCAVCSRSFRARALALAGRGDEAVQVIDEAVAHARELAHPFTLALCLIHAAAVHLERGDAAKCRERGALALRIAQEQSFSLLQGWASCFLGASLVELGDADAGLCMIRRGVADARATGSQMFQSHVLGLLARAEARTGALEDALRTADEALATSARTGERFYVAELHRLKGEVQLTLAPDAAMRALAEGEFRQALELARNQGANRLAMRAATRLAQVWFAAGLREQACALLQETCSTLNDGLDLPDAVEANALLAEASGRYGNSSTAGARSLTGLR